MPGRTTAVPTHALLHGGCRRGVEDGPFCSFFFDALSFVLSITPFFALCCGFLGAILFSADRPGRRTKGSLQRAAIERTADGKPG